MYGDHIFYTGISIKLFLYITVLCLCACFYLTVTFDASWGTPILLLSVACKGLQQLTRELIGLCH